MADRQPQLQTPDAPRWEPRLVENVQPPAFHHKQVGEHYASGVTREDILRPLTSLQLGELEQVQDEEEGAEMAHRPSVVKGYENTMIEMNPLKEAETAVDKFTRRWHVMLYSKVKNANKWMDEVEGIILKKDDLKAKYEALELSPSGRPYQRKDRVAVLLAYEFLKAHELSADRRDPVFWPISRYHAKKYDFLKFDNTQALNVNARLTLLGGLLYLGFSPDAKDKLGYSPLHYATSKMYSPSVYMLLRWKADPDCHDDDTKWTSLHVTAESNLHEIAEVLCQHGASPNQGDAYNDKPIHFATLNGAKEVIDVLLKYGAHPDARGDQENTPLHMTGDVDIADTLLIHNADIHSRDKSGNTCLHIAAYEGNEAMVVHLLEKGADPEKENFFGDTPLDYAAMSYTYKAVECFRILFEKAKERLDVDHVHHTWKTVRYCIEAHDDDRAAEIIRSKLSKVAVHICTVAAANGDGKEVEQGEEKVWSLVQLIKESRKSPKELGGQTPINAVLDKAVFGHKVVMADILEADQSGNLPSNKPFTHKGGSAISNLVKQSKLCNVLAGHSTLKAYVNYKWKQYAAFYYWRSLLLYIFQMIMLTFALAIAARPELIDTEINTYPSPLDVWRGICEVSFFIIIFVRIIEEIVELIYMGCKAYVKDVWNYVFWLAILLTVIIVPLRAVNHPGQWIVASLAFVAYGVKAFEYASLFRLTGSYLNTIWIILRRDVSRFIILFIVILCIFSGAFYFSMRYDDTGADGINADQRRTPGESQFLHEVFLMGFRSMAEYGRVWDYYGIPNGFRALSVILYISFLFVVLVVLLNGLIAMMVGTYLSVGTVSDSHFVYLRCRYIARVEREVHPLFCCWRRSGSRDLCPSLKQTMYRDVVWRGKLLLVDHPDQTRAAQTHRRVTYTRDKFARKFLKPFDKVGESENKLERIERDLQLSQSKMQKQLLVSSQEMVAMRHALDGLCRRIENQ